MEWYRGMTGPSSRDGAQAIHRAATLLREIASFRESGVSLARLARNTGLPRGTAHRILTALANEGLLEKNAETAEYRLGPMLSELGLTNSLIKEVEAITHPALEALVAHTDGYALFNLQSADDAVCIDSCDSVRFRRRLPMRQGNRRPLGVGASSLAILSCLSEEVMVDVAERNRGRYERYGLTPDRILDAARRTRERGYAVSTGRFVPGYRGLALGMVIPGWRIGAVTLSDLESRLSGLKADQALAMLQGAVRDIHAGFAGEPWKKWDRDRQA